MTLHLLISLVLYIAPARTQDAHLRKPLDCFDIQSKTILDDSLQWLTGSATSLDSAKTFNAESYFITAAARIEWVQAGGKTKYTFDVIGIEGEWQDYQTPGSVTVRVRIDDMEGTLVFARTEEAITIEMGFLHDGVNTMPYRFHVQQIQSL